MNKIIIIRLWEGLGNQMFQYAYARMLSLSGDRVYLDFGKSYEQILVSRFRNTERENTLDQFNIRLGEINVSRYKHYNFIKRESIWDKVVFFLSTHEIWPYKFYEESSPTYNAAMKRVRGNCYIKGWFQSEEYFKCFREVLLKEFTPKEKIRISPQLKYILSNRETVSIHIRRGDYVKYRKLINMDYYKKAQEIIEQRIADPIYIVFSDDYKWARKNLVCDKEIYFIDEKEQLLDYEQLLVMSKCRSNIIANSTFSWWAAWLNTNPDKLVIAPTKWFEGQEDLYNCNWIYSI